MRNKFLIGLIVVGRHGHAILVSGLFSLDTRNLYLYPAWCSGQAQLLLLHDMLKTVVSLITSFPGKSYKTHSGLFWACARIVESPYTGSEGLLWLGSGCSLLLIGLELEMNISSSQEMDMFWVRRA